MIHWQMIHLESLSVNDERISNSHCHALNHFFYVQLLPMCLAITKYKIQKWKSKHSFSVFCVLKGRNHWIFSLPSKMSCCLIKWISWIREFLLELEISCSLWHTRTLQNNGGAAYLGNCSNELFGEWIMQLKMIQMIQFTEKRLKKFRL